MVPVILSRVVRYLFFTEILHVPCLNAPEGMQEKHSMLDKTCISCVGHVKIHISCVGHMIKPYQSCSFTRSRKTAKLASI